jgi:hypothetical protein
MFVTMRVNAGCSSGQLERSEATSQREPAPGRCGATPALLTGLPNGIPSSHAGIAPTPSRKRNMEGPLI